MAAPTVLGIDIASGPPGTMVVLTGTNFDDNVTSVTFGGVSAGDNFTALDEVSLIVYVPAGTGTSQDIVVTNLDGSGTLAGGWSWDANQGGPGGGGGAIPTVTGLSLHTSAKKDGTGGDTVVITGTKFTTTIHVWFGGVASRDVSIDTDTQITAIAPPNSGTVYVYVQNAYGTSVDADADNEFVYPLPDPPTITDITPVAGTINTVVTITGTNFQTVSAVLFDVYTATFQLMNDLGTVIRCYAPEGPTAGTAIDISVVTDGGTVTDTGAFTYLQAVSDLTATAGVGHVTLDWSPIASSSPVMYEVYGNIGDVTPTTVISVTSQTTITFQQDYADDVWSYGVKVVDIFGNKSAMSNVVKIASLSVVADTIAEEAINAMNMFAATIRPPEVVNSLPVLPDANDPRWYPAGATVFLTTDNRLYRNLGGGPNSNSHPTNAGTWFDLTANSYDLTLDNFGTGATERWQGDGTAASPYRLTFDGVDSHCQTSSNLVLLPNNRAATSETWYRSSATPGVMYLALHTYTTSGTHQWYSALMSDKPVAGYKDSVGTVYTTSPGGNVGAFDGKWHQVVSIINDTTLQLYFDGVLLSERTGMSVGTTSCDLFKVGVRYDDTYPFNGDISCMRFYDHALSATEVATNFKAGPNGINYKTTGLVANYVAKRALESESWVPLVDPAESGSIISGDQIIGNSITAGSIAAGAIGAAEIASDMVMSRSVFVGSFENMMANGNNELSTTGRDVTATSPDYEFRGISALNPWAGTYSRRLLGVASGDTTMAITRLINVNPGERYYCECRAMLGASSSGHGHLKLVCYKSDRVTPVSGTVAQTDAITVTSYPTDPIKVKDGSSHTYYEIPAGGADAGAFIQLVMETTDLGATTYLYMDQIYLRRQNEGNLIVDGTITATNLNVELDITGKTITGGTIQTAGSGQRVKITGSDNKVTFYDSSDNVCGYLYGNSQYTQLDASYVILGSGVPGDNPYGGAAARTALSGAVTLGPSRLSGIFHEHDFLGVDAQYDPNSGAGSYIGEWRINRLTSNGFTQNIDNDGVNHPGVLSITVPDYDGAGAYMRTGFNAIMLNTATASPYDYDYAEFTFKCPSTASNRVRMGFMGGSNAWTSSAFTTGDYAAIIDINTTTVTGKVCINGTVYDASTYALSANTWYTARIKVHDGSHTEFRLYSASTGEPLYAPTDIAYAPTASSVGHGWTCWTSDATGHTVFAIDYMNYFLAPRSR